MTVYVIGNVAADETFKIGVLPKIGESILGRQISRDIGGKGANQAIVLARAGLPIRLLAAIGDDERGVWLKSELENESVPLDLLHQASVPTDVSIILSAASGDNSIVTTTQAAESLVRDDIVAALSDAEPGDILLLQGNLATHVTAFALAHGRAKGLTTVFNPSPAHADFAELWSLVDLLVANDGEAEFFTGRNREAAGRALVAAGIPCVIVTLGGDGALLCDANSVQHVPAEPCTVIDTTGAGDTFLAVLVAAIAETGMRIDRASLECAGRAAALTITRPGTRSAFPTRAELSALLGRR
ncbi:ribokinase [Aurantimonas sp. C2-6-R+9]|uniref:ribokinase n=1 Tax=unclassified Aurantimonas TaxID=2638230 RepID=UPI002E19BB82|nr:MULTISPECIES: ribokinase [unclassified Aurantimonas]MEC5291156.1 ribokinase [Aurantimonas sp. C2-3-R2]MEC5381483.1 ribokinase [Aurantimonas sp. C2-6-R+9]MEC5411882.1 ribokinase [Aurantimonas sp. C2-4-R8]